MQPTPEQVEMYLRDGLLVVADFSTETRWSGDGVHPIYSKYRRPGVRELEEAFFPVLWRDDGYRTAWVDDLDAVSRAA